MDNPTMDDSITGDAARVMNAAARAVSLGRQS